MTPSENVIDWLCHWEGPPSLEPRWDAVGEVWDQGYGCVCDERSVPLANEGAARALLRTRLAEKAEQVSRLVRVPLEQHQFDALVAFVYNTGVNAFQDSTLLRCINACRFDAAAVQFTKWVYSHGRRVRGLERRRAAEVAIFHDGDYHVYP